MSAFAEPRLREIHSEIATCDFEESAKTTYYFNYTDWGESAKSDYSKPIRLLLAHPSDGYAMMAKVKVTEFTENETKFSYKHADGTVITVKSVKKNGKLLEAHQILQQVVQTLVLVSLRRLYLGSGDIGLSPRLPISLISGENSLTM